MGTPCSQSKYFLCVTSKVRLDLQTVHPTFVCLLHDLCVNVPFVSFLVPKNTNLSSFAKSFPCTWRYIILCESNTIQSWIVHLCGPEPKDLSLSRKSFPPKSTWIQSHSIYSLWGRNWTNIAGSLGYVSMVSASLQVLRMGNKLQERIETGWLVQISGCRVIKLVREQKPQLQKDRGTEQRKWENRQGEAKWHSTDAIRNGAMVQALSYTWSCSWTSRAPEDLARLQAMGLRGWTALNITPDHLHL